MEKRKCPKCLNNQIAGDDDFCWNCGFELDNYCENPDCVSTENEESVEVLPDEFSYCPHCGSQTRYAKLGFVKPITFESDS